MDRVFRVSEAARQLGISAEWLRDAERRGKIPIARRDLNRWRIYTDEDMSKLKQLLFPDGGIDATIQAVEMHERNVLIADGGTLG